MRGDFWAANQHELVAGRIFFKMSTVAIHIYVKTQQIILTPPLNHKEIFNKAIKKC